MSNNQAWLLANGLRYSGWQTIKIHTSMEDLSGTFELSTTDMPADFPIIAGMPCQVGIDDDRVITGFVDSDEPTYDKATHTVMIKGHDKTNDLGKGSAMYKTGGWTDQKLDAIARDLCKPFGITVIVEANVGAAFSDWRIFPGESVFECLDRAARHRGVLLLADNKGNLLITTPSKSRIQTALVRGVNILGGSASRDFSDMYSDYFVLGQSKGNDTDFGAAVSEGFGHAQSQLLGRYRPLVIIAESQGDTDSLQKRADYEANVRAARSQTGHVKTQGWHHKDGLWRMNKIVPVQDSTLRVNRDVLINELTFSLSKEEKTGSLTEIGFTLPGAYTREVLSDDLIGGT